MDERDRLAVLESNLARQLQWIAAADGKAAFAFTLVTAMLGCVAALAPTDVNAWGIGQAVSAALTTFAGATSLGCLCAAAFPRTDGPKSSMVYCAGIAQRSRETFQQDFGALTVSGYLADVAAQCHRNAEIADSKFRWVQRAMIAQYAAVPFWLLSIWLLYSTSRAS